MLSKPNQPKNRNFVVMSEMNDIMQSLTSSRKIAKKFGKEHSKILAKIKNLQENQPEFTEANFGLSEYKDSSGKTNKEYLMTFKGFTFLVMGFTGKKAEDYKIWYINLFDDMARYIKENEIYRISVDSRNKMNKSIKSSGLIKLYGQTSYEQVAKLLNKMVFNSDTYPNYLKVLAKNKKYTSVRDMIRVELTREERMMKFLEDYLYNSLNMFNNDIKIKQAENIINGLNSLKIVIQNF